MSLEEYDQYDKDYNLLLKKEELESSQRILCGQKKKTKKARRQRWYWSKHLWHSIYLIGYYFNLFFHFFLNISNMVFKAISNSYRSTLGRSTQPSALCSTPALNIFSPRRKVSVLPEALFAGLTKPTMFITKMYFLWHSCKIREPGVFPRVKYFILLLFWMQEISWLFNTFNKSNTSSL